MRSYTVQLAGPAETLEFLRDSIRAWSRSPTIRAATIHALGTPATTPRTDPKRAAALLDWMARSVSYVPDPHALETLQSPGATLQLRGGDCDDHAALLGSMMKAAGLRVRLAASGLTKLSHVFPEVLLAGRWTAADSTLAPAQLGRRAPSRVYVPTAEV